CKSGTTAPGVQGAGRGPLATSLVTFLFAQERYPLSGRDPTTPPAGCREMLRRGNPSNPAPSQFQQPKGGGSLVSPHAALSPELGSKLKARSGCKSGTTAPGVQGAGRGPRRFLWLLSCPRKKVTRLSGRDPTTPPAGCRKILRRG